MQKNRRSPLSLGFCLLLSIFFWGLSDSTQASEVSAGIKGADDRQLMDSWESPWRSVGRVNVAGKSFCTGTLISSHHVLTAAHCLVWPGSGRVRALNDIHFVAGVRRDRYLGHSTAKAVTLHPRFSMTHKQALSALGHDIAVIELEEPLDLPFIALAEPAIEKERSFDYALYAKDRPYLLSVHPGCRLLEEQEQLWLLDCDTVEGGSGGPLLAKVGDRYELAGIVVGYTGKNSGAVTLAIPVKNSPGSFARESSLAN